MRAAPSRSNAFLAAVMRANVPPQALNATPRRVAVRQMTWQGAFM